MAKKKNRSTFIHLKAMIKDLKKLEHELDPNRAKGAPNATAEELKHLDNFQKQKMELTGLLNNLKQDIQETRELRKQRDRDIRVIEAENNNAKRLMDAKNLFINLKNELRKEITKKKSKYSQEELQNRQKILELLGQEILQLEVQNSNVDLPAGYEEDMSNIDQQRKRRAQRQEREKKRREKANQRAGASGAGPSGSGSGSGNGDGDGDDYKAPPMTQQTQEFLKRKAENDQQAEVFLKEISEGLMDLKQIAIDIGKNLDIQNEMLEQVDEKMDGTIENFQGANKKLKELLRKTTGGAATWCPVVIAAVILIGLIGYVINLSS